MLVKFCMIRRLWCALYRIEDWPLPRASRCQQRRRRREITNIAWCLALGLEERRGLNW